MSRPDSQATLIRCTLDMGDHHYHRNGPWQWVGSEPFARRASA